MPAVIALMAILMLFIAPVISKSLEYRRAEAKIDLMSTDTMAMSGMDISDADMNGDDMSAMPEQDDSQPAPVHDGRHADLGKIFADGMSHAWMDGSGMEGMGDIACGYCQLLIHLPLMVWVIIPFIWLMLRISRVPPAAIFASPLLPFYSGYPQPRAPPSINPWIMS